MTFDFLHGMVKRDFVEKLNFPPWFATALGLYKLTQLALNWAADGAFIPIAQVMMERKTGIESTIFTPPDPQPN